VYTPNGGSEQIVPPPAQLAATVHEFLYGTFERQPADDIARKRAPGHGHHHHSGRSSLSPTSLGLVATPSYAMQDARAMTVNVPFPVEIPR